MKLKKIIVSLSFIVITAFGISSCEDGINIFSDADDVQLGLEVSQEINNNSAEYPIYNADKSLKNYIVNNIFNEILASPKVAKKNIYKYSLEIVDNDSILNAFALPGGPVYVYTGLLKYLDSEAALAGVLGHEIAHAERRHATQRMTQYYGISVLFSLILGENPSQLAEIAANLFVGLAFLGNSRANEDESDEYSITYLRDTRFYPGGVKFFFEKLQADGLVTGGSGLETFFSTHPDPIDRIASANQRIQTLGLPQYRYSDNGTGIFRDEYQANIRSKLP
ncbi:MAG: M48 family metalloprotease [Ignavibacteriales bacterium]|nr:Beta-barrel assembly-enhancing protease [Ignavibacteriaceae bacterium]MCK6614884.1 M48 family metalloprotease [Ignavibacteriaceae bacterium]QOJ30005.1 MAG: M48 family metalloprotease [Ignavibacteriales bacterium]